VVNFGGGKKKRPFNIGTVFVQALLNILIPTTTVPPSEFKALKAQVM